MTHRLSKSRFVTGWTCPRLLWWRVHEPDAPESQEGVGAQDIMDQGNDVGFLATQRFPGGVLIDLPYQDLEGKVAATRIALQEEAPAIFEASFWEDNVFVAVDILQRLDQGFRLIEVKASGGLKEQYIVDAAIQTYVLRRAGLDVCQAVLMHLNKQYRHPDQGDLFVMDDVTDRVEAFLPDVPAMIAQQMAVLAGPLPGDCRGRQCSGCAFMARCWPQAPDHVLRLHGVGAAKAMAFEAEGVHTFGDVPGDAPLDKPAGRQLEAWRRGGMVVEPGLKQALEPFQGQVGFLDFETVGRAIPVWDGLGPWAAAPVQFSYHQRHADGTVTHTEHLAEGPGDPRPALAQALVDATRGADAVAMYTGFERTQIKGLRASVPHLADELAALQAKLVDLAPVVRDFVAHPDFGGSFSIKAVLPALIPDMGYKELEINDGMVASAELARLMLRGDEMTDDERGAKRAALLEYCHLDTLAMVRLLQRLEEIAGQG